MPGLLTPPRLAVDIAWATNPLVDLADASVAWVDMTSYLELEQGVNIGRRRANELDEPSPGTAGAVFNNTGGAFTQLNPSSPFFPHVKINRLMRYRSVYPESVNAVGVQAATGSGDLATAVGMSAPSGTVTSVLSTATATAAGTTTTLKCADADATDIEIGDVFRLRTAAGALKESTYFQVTGEASAAGTTTFTFSPAATLSTATTDVMRAYRYQWVTGLQPVTGTRLANGDTGTLLAGPDAIPVTAGLSYTWSVYVARSATAQSVSPRILWYDLAGAQLSETTGATTALTTALTRLSVTGTAPVGAVLARVAVANETTFPGAPTVAFRAQVTSISGGRTASTTVVVPLSVKAADQLLMWVSITDSSLTVATPAGWTAVSNLVDGNCRTYLFKAIATSSGTNTSANQIITVTTSARVSAVYTLVAYSGTDPVDGVHQSASAAEGTIQATHTTPNVTTSVANCWIISAVFDRSSTTSVWTKPAADTDRAPVYVTGAGAPTGDVSDNAAAVAIGTYGSKVFTSNVASGDATMWTVALKPNTASGGSGGTVTVTGGQFEQAASVSAWAAPGITNVLFVGHGSGFPTSWENGVRALCTISAVDRQKLLDGNPISGPITEQILSTSPVLYFPLNEDGGATGAGNAAATAQPALGIATAGTVTDEMLTFGGGTGPDGQPALSLTPTSTTVGKALRGSLTTPLGGPGVTAMSIVVTWLYPGTGDANNRTIGGCDDGKPTDGGALSIFDVYGQAAAPKLAAHLKFGANDFEASTATDYFNRAGHQAVAVASLSGGVATLRLYVDGVLKATNTAVTSATEFPFYGRWNAGCGAIDTITNLFSGTLSHTGGWNTALTAGQITDLWAATSTGFAGELSGARAARISAWAGVTATAFDAGQQLLEGHRADPATLNDNLKLIARSEGGVYFLSSDGYATIHDRARRINAVSRWTVSAADVDEGLNWLHDDQLLANDITVSRTRSDTRAVDLVSQVDDGYGVRAPEPIDTIVDTDTSALGRAQAYLARYAQPVSRPDTVSIELLGRPELYTAVLAAEISDKFTINNLPSTAPATSADLFVEGVGMVINHESWKVTFDASPASFDFGLILDDPIRGLLDTNYVGW